MERCFEDHKSELGMSHFEVRTYRSLRQHRIVTTLTYLFLAEVHHEWRGKNPLLTIYQLRTAGAAMVYSLWWCGSVRRKYLEKVAAVIAQTQERIRRPQQSHVKDKRKWLRKLGIRLSKLRCCILNDEVSL